MSNRTLTLFHSPNTRSTGTLILLEELGAPFELHVLNMKKGEQRQADYLAVNPMGKVPALRHGEAVVTEQVAIFIYLADLFPQAGLAPALDDPLRGPYLRWLVFYGACMEPAVVDKSMQRDPAAAATSPYGDYDSVIGTLRGRLRQGPYMLGERFTAADVLWGTALKWMVGWKLVPDAAEIVDYVERVNARPAFARARARDAELAAAQAAA